MRSLSPIPNPRASSRRHWLRATGLGLTGLGSDWLCRLQAASAADATSPPRQSQACVFIFLFGGPSHIDLWDMKPHAPVEVRGEFQPVATNAPGIRLCEHLPRLSRQADKLILLRSMTHQMPVHGPACSELYTGRPYQLPPVTDQARPDDWPSVASLGNRYAPSPRGVPPSIVLPVYSHFVGQSKRIAGQTGGRMGEQFNPLLIECDPSQTEFEYEGFRRLPEVGQDRLEDRRLLVKRLQSSINAVPESSSPAAARYAAHAENAHSLLHQQALHHALDLRRVSAARRDRFGRTRFGQSLLLAARLVESGVPLVTVNFDDDSKLDKRSPMWDTHHDNFAKLKQTLCPIFDQAFAAFVEDLSDRGLLESTLIVATGEFGRTPRVGQFSQNAMTLSTGRDHWPHAFTALLAGGGLRGGQTYGATNRDGGRIADRPVTPADLSATMLDHLGVDPSQEYEDHFQHVRRPLSTGRVLTELL